MPSKISLEILYHILPPARYPSTVPGEVTSLPALVALVIATATKVTAPTTEPAGPAAPAPMR